MVNDSLISFTIILSYINLSLQYFNRKILNSTFPLIVSLFQKIHTNTLINYQLTSYHVNIFYNDFILKKFYDHQSKIMRTLKFINYKFMRIFKISNNSNSIMDNYYYHPLLIKLSIEIQFLNF